MTWMMSRLERVRRVAVPCALALALSACGLLDVSNPTRLEEEELNNGQSADLLRYDAITSLAVATGVGSLASGMLSDEFYYDPEPYVVQAGNLSEYWTLDRRESELYEPFTFTYSSPYVKWHETRRAAMFALPRIRSFSPVATRAAYIGHLLAIQGYATLRLAEDYCPGFPLNEVVDGHIVRQPPLNTTQMFEHALALFDSAIVEAADSPRFLNFARVGKGRALLGLGRFTEAGTAVTDVPADYHLRAEFSDGEVYQTNPLFFEWYEFGGYRYSAADQEGGNGLDFVSANDPRVVTAALGPAHDSIATIYRVEKYATPSEPIELASGIEAQLMQAEAALHDGGDWRGILNALRAGPEAPAGLDTLPNPTTQTGREDLLFRERAFWLYGTGHRLADLRRLIAFYGRDAESVFPTGPYRMGGLYHTATSIAFKREFESLDNPAVTGCTSR